MQAAHRCLQLCARFLEWQVPSCCMSCLPKCLSAKVRLLHKCCRPIQLCFSRLPSGAGAWWGVPCCVRKPSVICIGHREWLVPALWEGCCCRGSSFVCILLWHLWEWFPLGSNHQILEEAKLCRLYDQKWTFAHGPANLLPSWPVSPGRGLPAIGDKALGLVMC